ncbi:SulP family inorganic anion transporter [Fluviicola chungangensis]|uniref:SulP family inorganic anion transporter n=1 Tax=Fluviicola chungangensis TaxID=2597671 RepID=A0A556MP01_9FLAO|nr:SulP family inorganic anion transporter [Fluviicola chungangensis]TSJ41691.1 SulP family inorganic anion transporter [Fluviicola chungangensis]
MKNLFKTWKQDAPAGLVVFLVAVPLCLGIALASEAPVFSGLIAGIIGGIVVGSISGSSIGVSGPAAGLAAIVAAAIHDLGSFEIFLSAVVFAGLIQLILGLIRAGFISYYFPNVVIKGMLAAIGLLIIFKQLPHAVGYDADYEGDESFFQADGHNTFSEIFYSLNYITLPAVVICAVSIFLLILWDSKRIQKTFLKFVPGPLIVVLLGIGATVLLQGTSWALIPKHRVDLGISGKPFRELFTFPDFSQLGNYKLYLTAATLAVVASLETLLSVDASDKLDPKKRITSGNRELLAQGIGNMASGLIGGLPVTQVVVRTSANVNSGGLNKLAAIIHGILIALTVLAVPSIFNYIPYASLAAILIMVGFKLAKPSLFKKVFKEGWLQFIPFIATILGILFTDLLIGISIGLGVSFLVILYYNFKLSHYLSVEENVYRIRLTEHMTFLNKASLIETLLKIPNNVKVIIDESQAKFLANDIIESIEDFKIRAKDKNIQIEIITPQKLEL